MYGVDPGPQISASARTRPYGGGRHRMAAWLRGRLGTRGAVLPGRPAPRTQVCSRAGVMMSATEKSLANCSGVPNIAAMRSVYLVR
jgi:hypothetical protein